MYTIKASENRALGEEDGKMKAEKFETGAASTSLWRLGDLIEELLDGYGLGLERSCKPAEGMAAACGERGMFATTDLPDVVSSAY
jgi:hypothetical protein